MFLKKIKQFNRNNNKGFTIIELLVVISIIGLLSTISVISLNGARIKSRDAKRISDVDNIKKALELYFNDKGSYPVSTSPITLGSGNNLVLCDGGFKVNSSLSNCPEGKIYMGKLPSNPLPNGTPYSYQSQSTTPEVYNLTFTLEDNVSSLSAGLNTTGSSGGTVSFTCGDIVDYAGESYPTVLIGTQCWFAKNLNIGTRINTCTNGYGGGACAAGGDTLKNQTTSCSSIQKYCYSDNEANCTTDGGLYQWDQAMCGSTIEGAQGICPSGFHIPRDSEQYILENYLKDSGQTCVASRSNAWDCSGAGTAMKAVNSSSFSELLIGYRDIDGAFYHRLSRTYLWSSLPSISSALGRYLNSSEAYVFRFLLNKLYGMSVRCLKD